MRRQQRGITAIGLVIILAMVGIIGYAGIRMIPVFMTQMKIRQILSDLADEYAGQDPSPTALMAAVGRRLDIEMVDFPDRKDFRINKVDGGYEVSVSYEDRAPFIANLSLVAEFDNAVEIRR
jgi:hypothetical protein